MLSQHPRTVSSLRIKAAGNMEEQIVNSDQGAGRGADGVLLSVWPVAS